jgi:hypothetical protein
VTDILAVSNRRTRAKVAQAGACWHADNLYTKLVGIQLVLIGPMVFAVL